jgi:hypothetical protein
VCSNVQPIEADRREHLSGRQTPAV